VLTTPCNKEEKTSGTHGEFVISNKLLLLCLRALRKFMYLLLILIFAIIFFIFDVFQILWLLLCCFLLAVELSVIIFGVWAGMLIVVNDDFSAKY